MSKIFNSYFLKIPVIVLVFSLLYLAIIITSCRIPMFWDMSYISQISNMIFDSNFSVFYSNTLDNGSSPLYSAYIALLWSIFGRSLTVAHLAIAPFVIGIVWQFYQLLVKFLDKKFAVVAFLLLLAEPTITAQTLFAGYDLAVCFLFLAAINGIIQKKSWIIFLAVIFIPLINIRGFSLVVSIFLIDLLLDKNNFSNLKSFIKKCLPYAAALVFLLLWMLCHYYWSGHFFLSQRRGWAHQFSGAEGMLRNLMYSFGKMFDFGRVFVFLTILFISFKKPFKKNTLLKILLLSVVPFLIIFTPFAYPASHRHYLHIYPLMIILFIQLINSINRKYFRNIIVAFAFISLLCGNLWMYPERYGNGWDSSLKSMPYFSLKSQMDDYLIEKTIEPSEIGSKWPMNFDDYDTYLNNAHFMFSDIETSPLKNFNYIVQSNISNNFSAEERAELNNKWTLTKEFRSWPVYIRLYENPQPVKQN